MLSVLTSPVSEIGDWKVAKCYEYYLAGKECPYDIEELHRLRQEVRDEINALQEEIANGVEGEEIDG